MADTDRLDAGPSSSPSSTSTSSSPTQQRQGQEIGVYSYVFQLKISHQNTFYKNHSIEFRAYLFRVFVMLDSTK